MNQSTETYAAPVQVAAETATFNECLEKRFTGRPFALAYRYLHEGEVNGPVTEWTWLDVKRFSSRVAAALAKQIPPGQRAVLLFAPGLDFIAAFYGCLMAGITAVPVPPPDPVRLSATLPRLLGIVTDAKPSAVLTTASIAMLGQGLGGDVAKMPWISVDELDEGEAPPYEAKPLDLAFLQYTSGSTGEPKGVKVNHQNLMANLGMIYDGFGLSDMEGKVGQGVSWLPFYHDMGLIGKVLGPVYLGGCVTLFSPLDFLKRPLRWLEAISHYGIYAMSGAPDFAYSHLARRTDASAIKKLDLSLWKFAFCGAEPVRPGTLELFCKTFAGCGFKPSVFCPAYGLAEATLFATAKRIHSEPVMRGFDPQALGRGQAIPGPRAMMSCGIPSPQAQVRIVHPTELSLLPPGSVGEIWLSGPHISEGYWEKPGDPAFGAFTAENEGPFLRTGDLGFIDDQGELYISGRAKDVMIIRGRNIHPHDIEASGEGVHPAIRPGGLAAFGIEHNNEEHIAMLCEVDTKKPVDAEAVSAALRDAIAKAHGAEIYKTILVPPRTILRTSSGKIRRGACRDLYLGGELQKIAEISAREPSQAQPEPTARGPLNTAELIAYMQRWIQERVRPGSVNPSSSFTSLGLDSLNLMWLAGDLEKLLGFEVPVQTLYGGTLKTTAALLSMAHKRLSPEKPRDLEGDALLDASIHPVSLPIQLRPEAPWFITGATGFVGAYTLSALMKRMQSPFICLVRASSDEAAQERLLNTWKELGLPHPEQLAMRVRAIAGELSRPRFGLSEERWNELCATIGTVMHIGAEIDWIKPYSSLKPVNLEGTREAVRLCCQASTPMHYVSTLGVFALAEDTRLPFGEDEDLRDGEKLQLGYTQSKWAAEKLLEHARARGLPVTVYRPGFVGGDSRTGAELHSEHQLFYAFMAGTIYMGEVPAAEKVIDAVPVDWLGEAIAALSLHPEAQNKRFNLMNPSPIRQRELYQVLRNRGYALREIAYTRFREHVLAPDAKNPLARFSVYYKLMDEQRMARLEAQMKECLPADNALARRMLSELGLSCPPLDRRLIDTYLLYYIERNLIPKAPQAPAPTVQAQAAGGSAQRVGPASTIVDIPDFSMPDPFTRNEPKLWQMYERGKQKQWDAEKRIDWSLYIDPEDPTEVGDHALPLYGSPIIARMTQKERAAARVHYQAWQFSQFMYGEQGAVVGVAKLLQRAPNVEIQMFAATQVVDEARHLEAYSKLLTDKYGITYPVVQPLSRLAEQTFSDRRWDINSLGLQILIEGLALGSFALLRDQSKNPLIVSINAYVMEDEARHVGFGRRILAPYYAGLSDAERKDREEFVIEASYMLHDRLFATESVWENLGLPVKECLTWIRESGFQKAWSSTLFSRIVPAIRSIGLWSPAVQKAYAQMGVLSYGDALLDELILGDETKASEIQARQIQQETDNAG